MKKSILILLSLVPVVVGWLINSLMQFPVIGTAGFYLLPLFTTVFWFFLGQKYARQWKPLPAVFIAHAAGIGSLLIYLWQFLIETEATRNLALAAFSQMFSASTPLYLTGKIAVFFLRQSDGVSRATLVALQIIGLVYMVIVFSLGLYLEKKKVKK